MGKPLISPLVKYEYEEIPNADIDSVFNYIMSLLIQDDPSIIENIDV